MFRVNEELKVLKEYASLSTQDSKIDMPIKLKVY
jgi:hypothetical protein